MANSNQQTIQEVIVDRAAKEIDRFFSQDPTLMQLYQKIEVLLKQTKRLEQKWNEARKRQQALTVSAGLQPISSATSLSYATISYQNQKQNILQKEEIFRVLSENEIFLDRIRKLFTGQEIIYTLGYSFYSEVIEQKINVIEMLKRASIGFESTNQSLKLRIQKSKAELNKAYSLLQKEQQIQTEKNNGFDVFRKWYFSQEKGVGGRFLLKQDKITSQGELYETYIYLKKIGKLNIVINSINKQKFSKSAFEIFASAINRSKNSTSGRQGGDVDDSQIKWYGASFASINENINTLIKLKDALNKFLKSNKKTELATSLKEIFTKNPDKVEKIEKAGQKEARKNIENYIKNFFT